MAQVVERERNRHRRLSVPALVVLGAIIFGLAFGTAYAITVSTIRLAGVTVLQFTDEARVEDVIIFSSDTVLAIVAPTDNTQPDKTYTVRLYLDGSLAGETTISWTADEIEAGVKKWVFFCGLDLSAVTHIQVEVVG